MKKITFLLSLILLTGVISAQTQVLKKNFQIYKPTPTLFLTSSSGLGAVINFNADLSLTQTANILTLSGGVLNLTSLPTYNGAQLASFYSAGDLAMGANSITITGSIAATGARATKVWTAAIESTTSPTVGALPIRIRTVSKTIGHVGHVGADFAWTTGANHTAQNLDLGAIVPAKARVIAIEIVCTETLIGNTDMTLGAGNASAGAQFIVAASCNTANEVRGIIDATLPAAVVMDYAAATKVWIIGDPSDATWADQSAGLWTVYVTYLDYN